MDRKLAIVEHGRVERSDALRIIDDYFARMKPHYETGEEAIAETLFGFSKGKDEFLEICIHDHEHTDTTYEHSTPRKFLFLDLPRIVTKEKALLSREDVKAAVVSFYDLDTPAFQAHWLR